MLAPFSAQVGLGTVFEPSYLRKSEFSRGPTFSKNLGPFFPQDAAQDGPRSTQDGSKIVLDHFFCVLIFRFDFGSFLVPFWCRFGLPNGSPGVRANLCSGPLGASKTVLGSSGFGSLVVLWFEIASFALLGSFWGRFWCSWGRFGAFGGFLTCFNRRFVVVSSCLWYRCVRCCFVLVFVVSCSLTHLLIYSSTHGPSTLSNPARRTARCAIK